MENKNIIFISNLPFDIALKQRPTYLCENLAKNNNLLVIDAPYTFPKRLFKLPIRILKEKNYTRVQFNFLLPARRCILSFNFINNIIMNFFIKFLIFKKIINNKNKYIIITSSVYLFNYKKLKKIINTEKLIYDCIDDLKGFSFADDVLINAENNLINICDEIVVVSNYLKNKFINKNKFIKIINNGVDIKYYEFILKEKIDINLNNLIRKNYKIVLVYIGAIDEWFDFEILKKTLLSLKNVRIVIIGPVNKSVKNKCDNLNNIFKNNEIEFLDRISSFDVPKYLKNFDFGIIPFDLKHPVINGVNPIKLYEYFACNLSVIANIWDEIKIYNGNRLLASFDWFVKNTDQFLINSINSKEIKYKIAEDNSWQKLAKKY